jgi:16S rRNA (adenine1518-N6/adenine1519-N6)-dimethyltransferase
VFLDQPRVQVLCLDALRYDFAAAAREAGRPLKVAGNLPYQITSPLLFNLADNKAALARAVLMMQAEVGERLVSAPGTKDYGVLAVLMQYHFVIERLFSLGPANFYPPPQVDSVVVALAPRTPDPPAADEALFKQVVKAAFGQRRKTLRNTLVAQAAILGLTPEAAARGLAAAGIDPGLRGETLSVARFVDLSNRLAGRRDA